MAHTPALDWLQQVSADYSVAEATGRSVHDVQAERRRAPSRRDFLKLTSAAAAGVVLAPKRVWARTPRIAIVGGGIAGLTAAAIRARWASSSTWPTTSSTAPRRPSSAR